MRVCCSICHRIQVSDTFCPRAGVKPWGEIQLSGFMSALKRVDVVFVSGECNFAGLFVHVLKPRCYVAQGFDIDI